MTKMLTYLTWTTEAIDVCTNSITLVVWVEQALRSQIIRNLLQLG